MAHESAAKPFYSVLVLAFACSVLVSGAAVGLRPQIEINKQLDQQKNILRAAGIYQPNLDINELFKNIEIRVVELKTGKFVSQDTLTPDTFNQRKAIFNPKLSHALEKKYDQAGLRRQENFSLVYLVEKEKQLDQIILPVRGKGLWSTMYGYVAIDADLATIRGITFYEHGETPGLGGEIENAQWQSSWKQKKLYNASDIVSLNIVKGKAKPGDEGLSQIDGISGATLTTKGVENLMHFWFGEHGFKPFLNNLKKKGASDV